MLNQYTSLGIKKIICLHTLQNVKLLLSHTNNYRSCLICSWHRKTDCRDTLTLAYTHIHSSIERLTFPEEVLVEGLIFMLNYFSFSYTRTHSAMASVYAFCQLSVKNSCLSCCNSWKGFLFFDRCVHLKSCFIFVIHIFCHVYSWNVFIFINIWIDLDYLWYFIWLTLSTV